MEIKNRIVMCSMGGTSIFGWMEPNHFDKEAANFLLERAKNNVGLILPGIAPIRDPMGGRWLYQNPGKFRKLKEYMEEFHKTGAKLFIQITAGFGRAMAVNDLMVAMTKNKVLGTLGKPIFNMDYILASASATPNRCCLLYTSVQRDFQRLVVNGFGVGLAVHGEVVGELRHRRGALDQQVPGAVSYTHLCARPARCRRPHVHTVPVLSDQPLRFPPSRTRGSTTPYRMSMMKFIVTRKTP